MNNYSISKFSNSSKHNNNKSHKYMIGLLSRTLVTIVLFLTVLILVKTSSKNKATIYKNVYQTNFSFAMINNWYQKYFGDVVFLNKLLPAKPIVPVFNEKLVYSEQHKYKDGVKLKVDTNYLIPVLESGLVVFTGEKDGYGKCAIVQQINGIDLWYGHIDNLNVKLYDYVEKGKLLGSTMNDELYLVYQKDGQYLDYATYIK